MNISGRDINDLLTDNQCSLCETGSRPIIFWRASCSQHIFICSDCVKTLLPIFLEGLLKEYLIVKQALSTALLEADIQNAVESDLNSNDYKDMMCSGFSNYMNSPTWKDVRSEVMVREGGHCQVCKEPTNEGGLCHHKKYDNWGRGDESEVADCVWVCKPCHNKIHKDQIVIAPFWASRNG